MRLILDTIHSYWDGDFYKLGGEKMNWNESQVIIVILEYFEGRLNKKKRWEENSKETCMKMTIWKAKNDTIIKMDQR